MAVGGVWSIWHVRSGLVQAVRELTGRGAARSKDADGKIDPTDQDLSGQAIIGVSAVAIAATGWLYYHLTGNVGLSVFTTVIMVVMSFFFTAVASYIVGLVGNSNSPVSGMTITAVLFTGAMMILFGFTGEAGMLATLGVAGVVCCAACTSGDVCNDLKTGQLIGASPRQQQIMQVAAVMTASFVMAPVLVLLHKHTPGGIGGRELSAPQATLFAKLAQGFFGKGELPRDMVMIGAALGGVVLVIDAFLAKAKSTFRLHIMPVAVGIYLPLGLSVPMIIGALINLAVRRSSPDAAAGDDNINRGVLVASGVIAGEALMGIGMVVLIALGVKEMGIRTGIEAFRPSEVSIVTPLLFAGVIYLFHRWSFRR
jgi:putative OPT family oligopeptide transporter